MHLSTSLVGTGDISEKSSFAVTELNRAVSVNRVAKTPIDFLIFILNKLAKTLNLYKLSSLTRLSLDI